MQLIIVTIQKKFFSIEFQSPYGEIGNATGFAEIEKVVSRQRSFSPLTGKSVMQLKKLVKAVAWTLRFSPLTGKSVMQRKSLLTNYLKLFCFSPLTGKSVMQPPFVSITLTRKEGFSPLTGKSVMQQGLPVSAHCADLCGALANLGCFSFK